MSVLLVDVFMLGPVVACLVAAIRNDRAERREEGCEQ